MFGTYSLLQFLHIMLFVYWLGADLGVFFAARYAARTDLAYEERRRFLDLLLLVDMGPRTSLILIIPVGFTLASLAWAAPISGALLAAIWGASLAWLALAWRLYLGHGSPHLEGLRRLDLRIRYVAIACFVVLAATSLAGHGPFTQLWLALKSLLFAMVIGLGVLLRYTLVDWVKGLAMLRTGVTTDAANALITGASRRARRYALVLWTLVTLIALLGVTKPFMGYALTGSGS
jgi:hypothetical protein